MLRLILSCNSPIAKPAPCIALLNRLIRLNSIKISNLQKNHKSTRPRQNKMACSTFRSKVYLKESADSVNASPAVFEKCMLRALQCNDTKMTVSFKYTDGKLITCPSHEGIRMEHPPGCPCCFLTPNDMNAISQTHREAGVRVGVAVIVQSSDRRVLITRRSKHLRTFPGVWVPPGGHLEHEETLQQAAFRELQEETGINSDEIQINTGLVLGLWESVYPPFLSMGLPKRHHAVVYLLAISDLPHYEIQEKMTLNDDEVDAAAWLSEEIVKQVAQSDDYGQAIKTPGKYFDAIVVVNGRHEAKQLCQSKLMASAPSGGIHDENQDFERLSTGTKFALRQWLRVLYTDNTEGPAKLEKADSIGSLFHVISHEGHKPLKFPFLG